MKRGNQGWEKYLSITLKEMSKLAILILCCWFCFLAPLLAADKENGKVFKIGVSEWTGYPECVRGFKNSMEAAGFIEGKNVVYIDQKSGLDPEKQREIALSFRKMDVDLVYSLTTPGTLIMKQIMPESTPIVFSIVTYPTDCGLIESFEYSGNNVVGTSNYVELTKYISLLRVVLPQARTMAIFRRNREPNSKIQAANIIRLAGRQGIHVVDTPLDSVDQVRETALKLAREVDVFMTTTDTLMQGGGERALIEVSLEKKIPILSSNKIGIEQGSTFGVVADFYVLGQISGQMAGKILKENIRPAELESKIQNPPLTLINRRSSRLLGITIPETKLENVAYVE
ncbi:MAG: ABC transporter substrate-binding protein [Desulfomonilaceae bacterium]